MKKKIRALALVTAAALLSALMVSCTAAPSPSPSAPASPAPAETGAPKTKINVTALKGPTGMGIVKLMSDAEEGKTENEYAVTLVSTPDEIVSRISSKEADIAAVPTNLAATLYNKTEGGVQLIALNTLGVLYILTNDGSVSSVADLKGKTIYATGQGATPEYALNYILEKNGLEPERTSRSNIRASMPS
jgi:NitT/TauT family transport system substrate-binding protein